MALWVVSSEILLDLHKKKFKRNRAKFQIVLFLGYLLRGYTAHSTIDPCMYSNYSINH